MLARLAIIVEPCLTFLGSVLYFRALFLPTSDRVCPVTIRAVDLYRAFNHVSRNQLVPALSDVEDSIERNNARAVYRSRSLLDQDLAVRTTSLAEIFRQLGFREIARIEALKTLSRDYTNYSAHRLLGEVLEGDFFADAKFSQQLISELLSPLSFNTFQSFDGFSSEASLNDYAALFDQQDTVPRLILEVLMLTTHTVQVLSKPEKKIS